jgi:hypothetical protein
MKRVLLFFLPVMIFCSCKMNELYINVIQPTPVTVPQYVTSAGIIDRSAPAESTKGLDAVDKALSLEGANLDKDGALASVTGLFDELSANKRFSQVKIVSAPKATSPGMGIYPLPMDWETVSAVCMENNVDALFSLELFDTDTKISYRIKKSEGKTLLGVITGYEQQADMLTHVKTGWRIYDPEGKIILDEINIDRDLTFSATGLTPVIAASALIDRKEAVKKVGNLAGVTLAQRLIPYKIRVYRDYYVKGTNNFEIAMRKARTGNWDEAGQLWKKETTNPSSKIAGRACYNMAIISEIDGFLDVAIEWARKAYEDYNNKPALKYIDLLEGRKNDAMLLNLQQQLPAVNN